ncbi:MAG: NYN domain-containing protein [Candidatus Omnitrophica bacterium]|nr:NYN domain-containing protein [Candidatus Omnitrophota bacterium]
MIHQIPSLLDKNLEGQREGLIRFLESRRPQGSLKNKMTVVFDGKAGVYGSQPNSYIQVIFSSDESADDKIRRIVSSQSNKKNIIVVTDDRDIQYSVRNSGAKVESVGVFLKRDGRKGNKSSVSQGEEISRNEEERINAELKNIWLKSKDAENN